MSAAKLSPAQLCELRQIADGARDTNRHLWTSAFRAGRDHARSLLRDLLDSESDGAFELAAIEMDAEACLHEGDCAQGFLSVLGDVRVVLPSWPWLPDATAAGRALLDFLTTELEGH